MTENWKPVVGYEEFYEVSDCGRVRSLVFRNGGTYRRREPPLLLSPVVFKSTRYHMVTLFRGGIRKMFSIHHLVLEAFRCPRPPGKECAHRDGTRDNNHISNLEWLTRAENHADKKRHGTALYGSRLPWARLNETDIPEIRRRRGAGETIVSLARAFGVGTSTMGKVVRRETWRHVPA